MSATIVNEWKSLVSIGDKATGTVNTMVWRGQFVNITGRSAKFQLESSETRNEMVSSSKFMNTQNSCLQILD